MIPRTSSIFILLRTLTLIHVESKSLIQHRSLPGDLDFNRDLTQTPVVVPDTSFLPFDEEESLIYRYRQQQSVNLGSWFVHENWMTPSLFSQASGKKLSELDIASGWGSLASARNVLEYHWLTFINQSDFDYLASIGINTVRLPIGYWSLGSEFCLGTPFANVAEVYQNAWPMVVHAINMAAKAGIGVLVDLHGAVGSQNGEGHSGISDGAVNLFSNEDYINKTIGVLEFLARNLVFVTNVVGIQLLNEPKDIPELTDFYDRAIAVMRQVSPAAAALPLYLHDGFNLQGFSDYVAQRTDFVVQDHHKYFVFTDADKTKATSQLTSEVNTVTYTRLHDASLHQHRNLIVGEWSCALTPTSLTNEPDKVGARRDFCTSQMKIYSSTTAGWSFWAYTKENCNEDPGWCFKAAIGNALPETFFSYEQAIPRSSDYTGRIASLASPTPPANLGLVQQSSKYLVRSHHELRFDTIHRRRILTRGVGSAPDGEPQAFKGYSDGYLTAKNFAMHNLSKLGFVEQYIGDLILVLGRDAIPPGTEDKYRNGFLQGLSDGEAAIDTILNTP